MARELLWEMAFAHLATVIALLSNHPKDLLQLLLLGALEHVDDERRGRTGLLVLFQKPVNLEEQRYNQIIRLINRVAALTCRTAFGGQVLPKQSLLHRQYR